MSYPMSFRLYPKQTQNLKQNQLLIMLPQMQQSIRLLQAPIMEISQIIEAEMEKNPLLEYSEEEGEEKIDLEKEAREEEKEVSISDNDFEILKRLSEEYQDFFSQTEITSRAGKKEKELKDFLDASIVEIDTLSSHLMKQANETFTSERELKLAEFFIGSLDEKGFLTSSIQELALLFDSSEAELGKVLLEMQLFDPPGVCARNMQESFLIQLKRKKKEKTLAYQIISTCFDHLIHNRIPLIEKKLQVTVASIMKEIEEVIVKLDFFPGLYFTRTEQNVCYPEAEIKEEEGKLVIEMEKDSIPSIRINKKYMLMLEDKNLEKETKDYIEQHMMSAKYLVKNIFQRTDTLQRILEFLIVKQRDFFSDPEGFLAPLSMSEVAEELSLHESTIARAVSNKYINTPRGMLALKSLFSTGYVSSEGEDISSHTVKEAIKQIIDQEDKRKPLSDAQISELLHKEGIKCARRTISKYRNEDQIGNANQRRKYA